MQGRQTGASRRGEAALLATQRVGAAPPSCPGARPKRRRNRGIGTRALELLLGSRWSREPPHARSVSRPAAKPKNYVVGGAPWGAMLQAGGTIDRAKGGRNAMAQSGLSRGLRHTGVRHRGFASRCPRTPPRCPGPGQSKPLSSVPVALIILGRRNHGSCFVRVQRREVWLKSNCVAPTLVSCQKVGGKSLVSSAYGGTHLSHDRILPCRLVGRPPATRLLPLLCPYRKP
jgi:hypothetical protein